jgi:hypothetical protein
VNDKAEDLTAQIQEVHKATVQNLQDSLAKYKASADKKKHAVKFDERDFVRAVLTKDRFPVESIASLLHGRLDRWRSLRKLILMHII